ncbi:MAG: glucose-6-phosphate isomerase [Planctomycetota bacterium]|nr:MAG: glucose-6-phosphate isomerase [Planctomycetota bacterium]
MTSQAITPLEYDTSGVMIPETGLAPEDLAQLGPELERARDEVLASSDAWSAGGEPPPDQEPLEPGFIDLPGKLLAEYRESRATSQLGAILATAKKLSSLTDRIVVLGIGGSYMGSRALFKSCCHPYFNELSRAERGSHPRMYFAGNNLDNDATQGLLDLLGDKPTRDVDGRWGIVAVSKSGDTLETAVALRQLLDVLRAACDDDMELVADLVVPVTGTSGRLFETAKALGCEDIFPISEGVSGRYSVMSAVGLLPASIMGLDAPRLLEGALAMTEHFRTAPPEENIVLRYAGVCHLMETMRSVTIRVLSLWSDALEATGAWHDQLVSESLGKAGQGPTTLSVVPARDLHCRGQQHWQGKRDKLITNVVVDAARRDRLPVGSSDLDEDDLNALAKKTLSDLMAAAFTATKECYAADGRPTADLHLPRLDEAAMGQFFQMMMLATVVEGRLKGINPYGQPGLEAFKQRLADVLKK